MTILWEIGGKGRKYLDPQLAPRRFASPLLMLAMSTTALVGLAPSVAFAQTIWDGSTSSDWFTTSNWDTNALPTAADDVTLDTTGINPVLIDGAAAVANSVYLGLPAGSGVLTIQNAGELASQSGFIGYGLASTGTVVVQGTNSVWDMAGVFHVGYRGDGVLTISNGGAVSALDSVIGGTSTGSGAATVDGAGSTWYTTQTLYVGLDGAGALAVSNGGVVTSHAGFVAEAAGSVGSTTIDGTNSAWNMTGVFHVGYGGDGTLVVSNGGAVGALDSVMGGTSTGSGTATVDGAGSTWASTNGLYVGNQGTGTLTVSNGGTVTSEFGHIGEDPGGVGIVTINGAGSSWTTTDNINVGYGGAGQLTIANGGTVTNGGAFIAGLAGSTGSVTVDGVGSSWIHTDASIGLAVGLAGVGNLTISNGGAVGTTSAVLGTVSGADGTVTVDGTGSVWTNAGDMHVGYYGAGSLAVENGGTVYTDGAFVAAYAGSTGEIIVDGAGSVFATTGTEGVSIGTNGTGSLVVRNGGSANTAFGYIGHGMGATGGVTVDGAGSTWTNAAEVVIGQFGTGTLAITDGGLVEAGSFGLGAGTLTMDPTGRLAVTGDVTIGANATYVVAVTPTSVASGSMVDATGAATIDSGATVSVLAGGGSYSGGNVYTILTADSGVTGTFGGVSANFAFLVPTLTYDATNVFLTLTGNGSSFDSVAETPNQLATAGGVEALGTGDVIYDAVVGLSAEQAQAAFDALSGEGHASVKGVLIENSGYVRNAVLGRLDAAFNMPETGAALGYAGAPILGGEAMEAGLWSQLYGGLGNRASDGNAARADFASGGLVLGTDGLIGDWRLGLLANAGITSVSIPDRSSSGNSTDYGIGLYGGTQWGDTGLSFGAAYTRHVISTTRDVSFPGFTDTLTASYGAATGQLFGELNHEFDLGKVSITPFAQAAYVNHATDAFTEQGGPAALSSAASVIDATFTTLGLRGSHQFVVGEDGLAELSGGIGWRHAFADTPIAANSFAGGSAFTVAGAPIAGDALTLEGGLTLDFANGMNLALTYDGQIAGSGQAHVLKAGLGGQF